MTRTTTRTGTTPSVRAALVALTVAAGGLAGTAAPAGAQSFLDDLFGRRATGSVTPASTPGTVPSGLPGERPWSGESGSSGHPEMTAQAIQAAAARFPACVQQMWPEAARRGVRRQNFDALTAGLTPELRLMDLMDAQPEFTKAFWDYLDLLVSDARIKRGREILAQHAATFAAVEKAYGVDRHIVAAIWGVESNFGTQIGDRSVLRSTATLACVGRRQAYFRDEFLAALEILDRGDVVPEHLKGSWAGAFGPTQFMPTSFKRYAVDFDGDGRRDVVDSMPDMIASTANNLKKDGWEPGRTWGYEVVVPPGFDYLMADGKRWMTLQDWARLGIRRASGEAFPRPADKAYLLVPAGRRGPAFLMMNNFRAIMKYNPAEAYALAIGHLADRMRGGGPIVQPWPRDERVLTAAERYELQEQLVRRGFDIGSEPNGRVGPRTRAAIKRFQAAAGLPPDGFASAALLDRLRSR
ncbi:lytic transglycosylase [Rhodoplanes elegans]|uniref:Lytic transglycosylase n=1 Tax=Rhodoplanes elegans TaxID=29408 RepID=A0A327K5U9_9BRAD|nr:lytic murein transglycosylase [Rhodoplanes elegans]MBK5960885.1 lytic transglycosylase [Rhodoplanes elegans]RAI33296.1 lytic transglycosylase [Rhodoplanes elegans]